MYVNRLTCFRVKRSESEFFRIERVVRQGCIMFPWIFNVYMNAVMKEGKMGKGKIRLTGFLYVDDLVLCGQSEEDLKVIVGCLVEVKIDAYKSKARYSGWDMIGTHF